jgi:putative RNA 2'-phosphotransferase
LSLDAGGWVDVDDLVTAMGLPHRPVTRELVDLVVAMSDKQRFAYDDTRTRIRANQGHSVPVDLGLEPATPPDALFHGTVDRFVAAIRREGLRPMRRHHVHLSPDRETATQVGKRRGSPAILVVDAAGMSRAGHVFYRSENGVWLTDAVPPAFLC